MISLTVLSSDCDPATVANGLKMGDSSGKARNGTKTLNDETSESMTPWVNDLLAVRDMRDEAAFIRVFEHFGPRVKAFLMRTGMDAALAEECAQEVLVTVWNKSHLYDATRASPSTWIFTIARNKKIDVLRKQKRPEPEDLPWGPEAEPDQADVIGLQQESEKLGRALRDLPEKQRELIEKAYFGDLSHSEIAEQTGLPLGTIKSRIRLALERLRHQMK
ncbi:RNA polymerase sigma factor RpoE [Marivita geojedonensis]|uniref:RNA polymerase sigma factor RpoE n=2 Tax=Marivita geojedonensis TaxID=1123756 RepID=A0A1X4NL24_9RHOB|nr:RNA polymerase sigma factor RpoE [Marivita geojedonensis]PRY80048.1 RNA polymerase sigma-70 factor (ECF subfamily) [Marivita geojedonensis]